MIFARKSLMKIHRTFAELHVKILKLFWSREPHHFTLLIHEYINLINELSSVLHHYSDGLIEEEDSAKLNAFVAAETTKLASNLELVLNGLEVASMAECTLLLINIIKVILITSFENFHNVMHLFCRLLDQ